MKSKTEISRQFRKHRQSSERGLSRQYNNTRETQAFYAGDFMSYRDNIQFTNSLGRKKKAMVQFNKVKPFVNAVNGFMAQNRRVPKYIARIPSEIAQEKYSAYCNALKDYVREEANADQVETQQDKDNLIAGYGAVETAMTYGEGYATTDPNGQILMGRLDPLCVGWDPYAKETNLLDKRWVFYKKAYNLGDAVELFDDASEEDFESAGEDETDNDSGYEYYPRGGRYNQVKQADVDWSDQASEIVHVYFYQWYEFESFYRADNPIYTLTNPQAVLLAQLQLEAIAREFEGKQNDDLFDFDPKAEILTFNSAIKSRLVEHFGQFITAYEYKRKVFYTAVLSGSHVFTAYRNVCQQGFTVKFKTGDYDAKNKIWTGMVNSMMEPALYYNKALTELMFIIGANSKGGVMYEEGSIEDIEDFEAKYAKTDANVMVNKGAIMENRIRPKREPFVPTGYEQVIQIADMSMTDVSGIDKTFLGSSENKEETGILQKRRIRQVVSSLACYFDAITLYQKEQARLLLDFLRIYAKNNDGGLFRIIGQNGRAEFVKIAADKLAPSYDVTIQEAPQSPEDKQEFAAILSQIGDKLLAVGDQAGKAMYALAVKYLPLDEADKQQVMGLLTPDTQQIDPQYVQQLEQQLQAVMSEVTQADVKEKLSKMLLNMAQAQKVKADTIKTRAEAKQTGIENALIQRHVTGNNISVHA